MFQKYISRRRKFSILSFVVALTVLLYLSFLSFRQIRSLRQTEQLVTQSYQTKLLLGQLLSYTKEAEADFLGYAATQNTDYLTSCKSIPQRWDSIYRKLLILTETDATQQENLRSIQPLFSQLSETFGKQQTVTTSAIAEERTAVRRLQDNIQHITNNEDKLLELRKAAYKDEVILTPYIALLLLSFSILKFFISFYVINNDFKKINKVSNELKLMNDSFEHAEEIAQISHWQWDLQSNKKLFSDNQYRMLGCAPGEFEPTFEAYAQHIHPDDRERFLRDKENLVQDQQPSDSVYRVIRKDGALRYFKSTGRLLSDGSGKKVIVGIKYDITEQYLVRKELEERNMELTNRNIELASFNYIASHDLQEPLRKIQLFISKILDDKDNHLSAKNVDYFSRMQTSANRMQQLIQDLLTYSKTNSGDTTFEACNLNTILESVKEELQADERTAIMHVSRLPVIHGISFQLKQLFSNLIDNSIKYRHPDRLPEIHIGAQEVSGDIIKDIPGIHPQKRYQKITVSDNGIGFEQQYSKQIFTLFQRLHDRNAYSGTGIGLAICKKVAENHNGCIIATGTPMTGATFDIYLPVS